MQRERNFKDNRLVHEHDLPTCVISFSQTLTLKGVWGGVPPRRSPSVTLSLHLLGDALQRPDGGSCHFKAEVLSASILRDSV